MMQSARKTLATRMAHWWFRRRLFKALALKKRGGVRPDGLSSRYLHNKLEIEWLARGVHPWQRDLSQNEVRQLFAEQCLDDTRTAIERLFFRLPEVDSIDFRVIDPGTYAAIVRGLIRREEVETDKAMASGMKLRNLGATFRLNDFAFEPLTSSVQSSSEEG